MQKIQQAIIIVLDSVGIGEAPDAEAFGDLGSNTLGNLAEAVGGVNLPNMASLGLGYLGDFAGVPKMPSRFGAYGRLTEVSAGKDTTTGHWELAGVSSPVPFPTFPNGFPAAFIAEFERRVGRKTIGNFPASGTEILVQYGQHHLATGDLIVYTSGDSVFQIAAHEEVVPIDELYAICETARAMLVGDMAVARVIARPFLGQPGDFKRTENRRDFSLVPWRATILDHLKSAGWMVAGVGKIEDIFAHQGLTHSNHTGNNLAGVDATIEFIKTRQPGLVFANLVDFDALYGHRNDSNGYARALEVFDQNLPRILEAMSPNDILFITADHGNDPTTPSTDHSRERVPLLIAGGPVKKDFSLGTRASFADLAATLAVLFGVPSTGEGQEFASLILN
ncbi:MAG: phosphopentomutase [Anaerolineales bacterium]|nr:phosphopentomutase [Anaerolineales bacterium]